MGFSNNTGSASPTGNASGDLGGTYPSPTVTGLEGTITLSGAASSGQVLTATSSSAAHWATPSAATPAGNSGDIQINSSSSFGTPASDALFWDNTHGRLGIGVGNAPGATVHIVGVENGLYSIYASNNTAGLSALFLKNTVGGVGFTMDSSASGNTYILLANSGVGKWQLYNLGSDNTFTVLNSTTGHNPLTITASNDQIGFYAPFKVAGDTTGGGTTVGFGTNSPANTLTAPYTWIKMISSDGSTVYCPAYK